MWKLNNRRTSFPFYTRFPHTAATKVAPLVHWLSKEWINHWLTKKFHFINKHVFSFTSDEKVKFAANWYWFLLSVFIKTTNHELNPSIVILNMFKLASCRHAGDNYFLLTKIMKIYGPRFLESYYPAFYIIPLLSFRRGRSLKRVLTSDSLVISVFFTNGWILYCSICDQNIQVITL